MGLTAGIVGLPNVGKSTLFNAITKKGILAANYPFATIEPNVGVVTVPDERLEILNNMYQPERLIPTAFEFTDIAGLVKGASQGEGLGNKFLSHIRETDAIVEVVRCFENNDIIHVEGEVDPIRDIEIINLELVLADLESIGNRIEKIQKKTRTSKDKDELVELEALEKAKTALEQNKALRIVEFPVTVPGTEATDVSAYLDRHREQIRWLNQSMNMRARTLLACCRAIVAFQEPFFRGITSHPRSMTLADIARRVDMHESTVSRAMHGKYVQCERGCLALTSLFSRSVGGSDGSHTQRELCDEISRLILGEAKDEPLSDMRISKMLAEKGMRISRRTVAKYRDAMGIPAAAARKRG